MDLDFMLEHLPRLLKATKLTIQLTLLSLFFGIFVGVFFAILRTSKNKFFYSFAAVLYLFLTFLSMKMFNRLEKNYSKGY